jgi:hypothetical protein
MTNRLAEILHRDDATRAKHEARALQAIANERCASDLTDGFCGPRDGACHHCNRPEGGARVTCTRQARAALHALQTVGMTVVWEHDPALQPAGPLTSTDGANR